MTYPAMTFPHGVMVPHRRPTANGRYGTLNGTAPAVLPALGPCNVVTATREAGEEHQSAPLRSAVIDVLPTDADVREGDQLLVDGDWMDVVGQPGDNVNSWTGWRPSLLVRVERTRMKGATA
ncbi:hypothetical protein K8O93_01160 [Gordonia bronchialis]|uniref:hypothetical protein n=1 Tax=Gordonia bronchialis TaxID=2054 RepID=UPI001CBC84E2|nr:hypothetical protein [Gordonia bronchialis]UAK38443.1 hypothetical protein K8O93_01160 [Gordonia bronchialis]